MNQSRIKRLYPILFGGGVITYTIRDDFSTDVSAGSVDGSASVPGPGTRKVTDTENKVSITGGNLRIWGNKAAAAWGNPALWLSAVTRANGVILVSTVNVDTKLGMDQGFMTAQSSRNYESAIGDNGTAFRDCASGTAIAAYSQGTTYYLATILRTAGHFHFIKGGAFTEWNLIYASLTGSTATLYPGAVNYGTKWLVNFMRIPRFYWTPAVSAGGAISDGTSAFEATAAAYSVLDKFIG